MVGLIILGVLIGLIVLILLIPVGADLGYEDGKLHVSAKVMGMLLQLYPKPPPDPNKPPREKKPKKEKKKKEPEEGEEQPKKKRKLPFNRDELLELVQVALKGFGKLGRKFQVDRFVLRYTAAGYDPYNVAMTYGWVNAALSSLAPLCRERFTVKDCEVRTDVDFTADWMHLDLGLCLTIRIGQILGVVLGIGFGALKILLRSKRQQKREAKLNPPEPAEETAQEEAAQEAAENTETLNTTIEEATAVEERKNSNG